MGKKARQVQARPPDDAASEDSDDSDVEAARREDERGRTVLAAVGKAIQNGTKIPLEWHPVYKIPCGEYKPTFATYIGVVVRERVCISYEDWKKVPQEVLDELYDVISKGFNVIRNRRKWILQQANERWRAFKTRLRVRWLYHKKTGRLRQRPPTSKYPWFTQSAWDKFKMICTSENFKKRSEQGRERSKLKSNCYRGGRLGYQYYEEELAKECLKQGVHVDHIPRHELWLRAHSREKDGVRIFDNPIDQEVANSINALKDQVKRGEIVISGHRDDILARALKKPEHGGRVRAIGSGITNREYFGLSTPTPPTHLRAELKDVQEKLEVMNRNHTLLTTFVMSIASEEQLKQFMAANMNGQFASTSCQGKGPLDVSNGQVNNIPFGDSANQRNDKFGGANDLDNGKHAGGVESNGHEAGFFTQLLSSNGVINGQNLLQFETQLQENEPEPYKVPWPNSNEQQELLQVSPSQCCNQPSPSLEYETEPISNRDMPEGLHECSLAIELDKGVQFVAIGEVYIPGATEVVRNHFRELNECLRRVSITKEIVSNAKLPYPTEECIEVCQAVHTFVPWPSHLIFPKKKFGHRQKKQVSPPPSRSSSSQASSSKKYVITKDDQAKVTSGLLEAFKKEALEFKKNGEVLRFTIPESVYYNVQEIMLDYEDMLDWCFQREIGSSHISIFMRSLSEMCQKDGISGLYGFIDPSYISPMTPIEDHDRYEYLFRAFGCNGGKNINQLFFAPYNDNRHWMLAAISPWNGSVFWLDPAGKENDIRPFAQQIINEGIKKFSFVYRKDVKKVKKSDPGIKWFQPQCPRQPLESKDCGYYVCRYMLETIESRRPLVPDKYFQDIATYSQELIDEMRDSWVSFVLKKKEVGEGMCDALEMDLE